MLEQITGHFSAIQSHLSKLDRLERRAAQQWAIINFEDTDAFGRALPVNTVMRRQHNTVRRRYREAVDRAKRLAHIARRAIEFRLGVDLSEMHGDMTLVPPPSDWADRLCAMQGLDYERIRAASEAEDGTEDPLFDPEQNPAADHYADQYLGDYVTRLEDFVESYNIDHPFTDESDVAVISLRDDLMRARQDCAVESYNYIYYSDSVGYDPSEPGAGTQSLPAWKTGGCAPSETGTEYSCVRVEVGNPMEEHATRLREVPREQVDLFGTPIWTRAADYQNTGYVSQVTDTLSAGYYLLSWWAAEPLEATATVDYGVSVVGLAGGGETEIASRLYTPTATFERQKLAFEVTEAQAAKVRFHPSYVNDPAVFGDVSLKGVQLERIEPWQCADYGGDCLHPDIEPRSYQPIWDERVVWGKFCTDSDGSAMRSRFTRKCICANPDSGICEPGSAGANDRQCFWQTTFALNLADIESGALIPSHAIALYNFNYRHEDIAFNIVGTNVRDCASSSTPGVCGSNAYVPYTFEHAGVVHVRNREGDRMRFEMPVARIEHGKGLSAEVVVTNPPTSNHQQLLAPYLKTGLRGRPLQGTYTVRIWDIPELQWNAVEDIQLYWKYRYWTRMDKSDE